ncbi:MAG: hypothetical protein ACK5O2_05940 [Microthrixaceae bacterium]
MAQHGDTSLLITGAVRRPLEVLQRSGPMSAYVTLVEPEDRADHATVRSRDGLFSASVPLDWLNRGHLESGRLVIPDAPTRCWSVKDVVSIHFTEGSVEDSVRPESFGTT